MPKLRNRTVLALADLVEKSFEISFLKNKEVQIAVRWDWLRDFLFANEYPTALVTYAAALTSVGSMKQFVLMLHSGAVAEICALGGASPGERDATTDALLLRLSADIIVRSRDKETLFAPPKFMVEKLVSMLALDGYELRDARLVVREENAFDVHEAEGELRRLYGELGLESSELFVKDLELTDEHYVDEKWGDSIKHARDAMETALKGVARAASKARSKNLSQNPLARAVRDFLRAHDVVSKEEFEVLDALNGLLSQLGGHSNMSEREHARMCRQFALTTVHFILLRWQTLRATYATPANPTT